MFFSSKEHGKRDINGIIAENKSCMPFYTLTLALAVCITYTKKRENQVKSYKMYRQFTKERFEIMHVSNIDLSPFNQ